MCPPQLLQTKVKASAHLRDRETRLLSKIPVAPSDLPKMLTVQTVGVSGRVHPGVDWLAFAVDWLSTHKPAFLTQRSTAQHSFPGE